MSTLDSTVSMLKALPETEVQKVFIFTKSLFDNNSPIVPMSESELLDRLAHSRAQSKAGMVQDIESAIDDISRELGI